MTSGLLVVDKPAGITSHQVVARARRALGTKKVGHAGTLDPMATGVLVLGIERATRLLGHLALDDKTYLATIRLGQATDTDDADGTVTDAPGAGSIGVADVDAALAAFRGRIRQVPSSVSAIKVGGKRAYALVRSGEEVTLAARDVTVSRFDVLDSRTSDADGVRILDVDVVVDCTSGTYVRALARDLGRALGVGGHLTMLRRTRVGPFPIEQATWDAVTGVDERQAPALMSMADAARLAFAVLEVDADAAREVGFGRRLDVAVPASPTALIHDGRLLALYGPEGGSSGGAVPIAVLVGPGETGAIG